MKHLYFRILLILSLCLPTVVLGQTYAPITVTGFNYDAIAEVAPASASTTASLDGIFVLYNLNYATTAGLAGGLPDNGTIVSGARTYQLQPYNQNNVLQLVNNQQGTLQLTTPKAYTSLSIAGFSTYGGKNFTVEVKFTDGTSYTATGSFNDWFNATGNIATAIGRVNRSNGTTDNNTPLNRPSLQKFDIALTGGNEYKIVDEITITSEATGNAVNFISVSGVGTPPITCPGDIVVNNDAGTCGAVVNFAAPIVAVQVKPKVLLLAASSTSYLIDVQTKLLATNQFNVVDIFDSSTATPTLAFLQQYDAILVWSQAALQDATATGNVLASYIDGGGGVVDAFGELLSTMNLQGAYNTSTYRVILPGSLSSAAVRTLGTVLLPAHPVMEGVTSFNGGSNSYQTSAATLSPGSYTIAQYDNANIFIAAKENVGPLGVRRVSLNFWPVSQDANLSSWVPSTDGALIMANALRWVAKSGTTQTAGLASGSAFPVGVTTNTFEVTDIYGTTSTCSFTVTVNDNVLPTAVTQPLTVMLNGVTGQATVTAAQIDNGSSDNCTIQTMTVTPDTFDATNVGANIVTLTVTDASGNTATATATVTVTLPPAPVITCPADIVVSNDAGDCGAVVNYPENLFKRVLLLASDSPIHIPDVQAKLQATGRFAAVDIFSTIGATPTLALLQQYDAVFVWTFATPNDATALGNVLAAYIDGGGAVVDAVHETTNVFIGGAYNTDTYRVLNPLGLIYNTPLSLGLVDMPSHPVMTGVSTFDGGAYSYHSSSTSLATGAYIVAHYSDSSPFIIAKENVGPSNVKRVSLNFYPGSEDMGPGWTNNLWQNNTDGAVIMANALSWVSGGPIGGTVTQTAGLASGQAFPQGVTTNTYTVTDIFGQTASCSFDVTVNDTEAPTVVTQNITVQLDAAGAATITPAMVDNGSSDNCAIATMALDITAFDCTNLGTNTVMLTVSDVNGNSVQQATTVTVEDTIDPIAVTQNITVQLDASGAAVITPAQIDNGSSDNCSIATMALDVTTFDCTNIGTNNVVFTVTDAAGNTAVAPAVVTVEDVMQPTVVTQNITVQLDASGTVSIIPSQVDNGSNDNCTINTMVLDVTTFDCTAIGANTVTLTVTDVNGNTASGTAIVTVEDTTAPVIICIAPSATTNILFNGSFETGNLSGWTAINNPGPFQAYSAQTGNAGNGFFPNALPTAGTYLAGNGFDGAAGTAVLYQDIVIPAGAAAATLSWDENIDYDLVNYCSGCLNRTHAVQVRDLSNTILQTVHTVTAVSGTIDADNTWNTVTADLSAYAGQTIRIAFWQNIPQNSTGPAKFALDNVELMVTQGSGTTLDVPLDASGSATVNAADLIASVTENCNYTVTVAGQPTVDFDCTNIGSNSILVTVTDASGNVATCTSNINVIDTVVPAITCPSDVAVSTNAGICTATGVVLGSPVTSDNCAVATVTNDAPAAFIIGVTTVTWTVTDTSGNTATCTQTVTVTDTELPAVLTQDINVQLDATGAATITAAQIDNGSSDNCGIATITLDVTTFDCTDVGSNTVTLTVTDIHNNVSTATAVVTVDENIAPTVTTQDITVQLDASGSVIITPAQVDNGSSDNCAIATMALDITTFDCTNLGPNTVALTVTDVNGNSATRTAVVTVEDTIAPTVITQDITVQLDVAGTVIITPSQVDNNSADNCTIAAMSLDITAFDCTNIGPNTVTLTVTDTSGNVAVSTAVVTVEDTLAPIVVTQDIIVQLDAAGTVTITPAQIDNVSSDNCAIATITLDITAFDCTNVGPNTVTLTVTDVNGNSATNTAVVTVEDTIAPTVITQDITVQLDAAGTVTITPAQIDNGSSDNCTIASMALDIAAFDCSNVGPNTVVLTVTDVNGNSATNTAVVTVEDTIAPTVITQDITVQLDAAGTVTISPAQVDNGSSDNCTIASMVLDITSFDCTNVGPNTVVLTVTDVNGNLATNTAVVTVQDTILPVAVAQDITVELDAVTGLVSITPAQIDNGSSDNCSFTLSLDITNFDCTNVGPNNVVLTVTDASGNTATAPAVVTVEDNTLPTVITQNFTIPLNSNGVIMLVPSEVDGGSYDNCGILSMVVTPNLFNCNNLGSHVVTLTVTDSNGNINHANATVTVIDMYDPVAVANNLTVQLDATGTVTITPAQIDGGSSDVCGIASMALDQTTFDCSDIGQHTVTLTVTDNGGNTATDTAIVTVEDVTPPVVAGQPVTLILDANGQATLTVADVDTGTADNCGLQSLVVNYTSFDCEDLGNSTVTLIATDIHGNVSSANFTVTVVDNIVPTAVAQDISISLGTNGFATITPEMINNNSTDNCGIYAMSLDITGFNCANIGPNTVTLTVRDEAGNTDTATAVVTVLPVPVPQTTSATQTFCKIDQPKIEDIDMVSSSFLVWYADATTTTPLSPATNLTSGTTYYATTRYGNCYSDRIAIAVIVNDPPAPTGEPIQFVCNDRDYFITDLLTNQQDVIWYESPVGGTTLSASTVLEHNNIYYAAYVSQDCESSVRLPVRAIVRYCDVTVHNAVSANDDGKNDYFNIEGAESFDNSKLEIFNRWGVTVYEATRYGQAGNVFKGYPNTGLKASGNGLLPTGTYYYVFSFTNHDGQAVTKTGFLHLTY